MLVPKKSRPKITPLKAGIAIVLAIILGLALQIAVQTFPNTVYCKFLFICILGFGFLIISFMLKFG